MVLKPNLFRWPPIDTERAREAIEHAKRDSRCLLMQPSKFMTACEENAVRTWFMREGTKNSTFNSTLHLIAGSDNL